MVARNGDKYVFDYTFATCMWLIQVCHLKVIVGESTYFDDRVYVFKVEINRLCVFAVANFSAYLFAPAILVTPLGALSVLIGFVL